MQISSSFLLFSSSSLRASLHASFLASHPRFFSSVSRSRLQVSVPSFFLSSPPPVLSLPSFLQEDKQAYRLPSSLSCSSLYLFSFSLFSSFFLLFRSSVPLLVFVCLLLFSLFVLHASPLFTILFLSSFFLLLGPDSRCSSLSSSFCCTSSHFSIVWKFVFFHFCFIVVIVVFDFSSSTSAYYSFSCSQDHSTQIHSQKPLSRKRGMDRSLCVLGASEEGVMDVWMSVSEWKVRDIGGCMHVSPASVPELTCG